MRCVGKWKQIMWEKAHPGSCISMELFGMKEHCDVVKVYAYKLPRDKGKHFQIYSNSYTNNTVFNDH